MKRFNKYPLVYVLNGNNYGIVGERRALLEYWSRELTNRREGFYFFIYARVSTVIEESIIDGRIIKHEKT